MKTFRVTETRIVKFVDVWEFDDESEESLLNKLKDPFFSKGVKISSDEHDADVTLNITEVK